MLQKVKMVTKKNIEDKAGHSSYYYDFDRNKPVERKIKFFSLKEFDSPDDEGSGNNMDLDFVRLIDEARETAGIPFKITSGYRTPTHNTSVGGSKTSSHMNIPCNACDIAVPNSSARYKIIKSLLNVGVNRIGIGKNFIHCDTDSNKSQNIIWHYY
jgi:zinc D-Ala-D-Ala carboxypeptidase|tara:strand:- start:8108 stop:8575 length:468 start_codon:yes stop_codon:yes gene_type:complete